MVASRVPEWIIEALDQIVEEAPKPRIGQMRLTRSLLVAQILETYLQDRRPA